VHDLVSVQGRLIPAADIRYPKGGIGWLRGFGVYETMIHFPGGFFQVPMHMERLRGSTRMLRMPMPDPEAIQAALDGWARATELDWAWVRVVVLEGEDGPWWMIEGEDMGGPRPELPQRHLAAWISDISIPHPPLGGAKTISRVSYELAALEARENGADDAIMPTTRGELGESTRASVFWRQGDHLFTPPLSLGILPGVTRSLLVQHLPARGMEVRVQAHPIAALWEADEIFVSSTIRGVAPVIRLLGAEHSPRELSTGPAVELAEEVLQDIARKAGLQPSLEK
jgi:branched-subunit amino acid aminotransferase/4-amino-4-deoxychorismate lyase